MKTILFSAILALLILPFAVEGFQLQDSLQSFNAKIEKPAERKFDSTRLQSYKEDPDFQYTQPTKPRITWWDRFLYFIGDMIFRLLSLITGTLPGRLIFYMLCAAIIIFAIIKLFNIDVKDAFFAKGRPAVAPIDIQEENIHEISFDERINDAVNRKDFREAVRLVFLFALKKLSDNNVIHWKVGKTNDEYLKEVNQHPARLPLQELRLYFDYAWYGHFEVDEHTFNEIEKVFNDFKGKLA